VSQGFFVVGAFLAPGVSQTATENLPVVFRGGEKRIELKRVLALQTGIWIMDSDV
jgi:hypothetical protein